MGGAQVKSATDDPEIDAIVQIIPVSPKVNKPSYNEPDCVEPLAV
jgi:hypothetical protein